MNKRGIRERDPNPPSEFRSIEPANYGYLVYILCGPVRRAEAVSDGYPKPRGKASSDGSRVSAPLPNT